MDRWIVYFNSGAIDNFHGSINVRASSIVEALNRVQELIPTAEISSIDKA